jgi:hypothetical protein
MQQRTFNPKYTHYRGDGFGRDNYIIKNNGGFLQIDQKLGSPSFEPMTFSQRGSPAKANAKLFKQPTCVYYPPDGTGRDSYIISGHGGTTKLFRGGSIDFQMNNYLRDNKRAKYDTPQMDERIRQRINPTEVTYYNWPSRAGMAYNRSLFKKQNEIVSRLSPCTSR